MLMKSDANNAMSALDQRQYQSGVGKLLYLAKSSRPDIQNIKRELSRHFSKGKEASKKAMKRVMTYCVNTTKERVQVCSQMLRRMLWRIMKDSKYWVFLMLIMVKIWRQEKALVLLLFFLLNNAVVVARSKMQQCVSLSVAKLSWWRQ
jgi:hypothetical protein